MNPSLKISAAPMVMVGLLALVDSASALDDKCQRVRGAVWPDLIVACTVELQSGRLSNKEREQALRNRSVGYFAQREYDKAILDINELILLVPEKNALNFYSRGNVYYFKGDMDRAIQDYDQVIKLDPNFRDVQSARKNALAKKM